MKIISIWAYFKFANMVRYGLELALKYTQPYLLRIRYEVTEKIAYVEAASKNGATKLHVEIRIPDEAKPNASPT